MFECLRFDEDLAEIVRHHPFGSMLRRIYANDGEAITANLCNTRADRTGRFLEMNAMVGIAFSRATTTPTRELTGHWILQVRDG
jgi:hypothetical protein